MRLQAVVVAIVVGLGPAKAGQHVGARPMRLVDLINVPRLSSPQLSPDGRQVLHVLGTADWEKNRRIDHIWRVDIDGTNAVQLTSGADGEGSPRWSPDGRSIAFIAKRGDDERNQIYVLPASGGEARRLGKHETAVSAIEWAPTSTSIYFLALDPRNDDEKRREKKKDDVFAFDEDQPQQHLWRVVASDGAERRLSEGRFSVLGYNVSRDGRRIVQRRAPDMRLDSTPLSELWVTDADGNDAKQITSNRFAESDPDLSPDGTQILFTAGVNERFEDYHNSKLFLVPAAGGAPRLVSATFPYEIGSAAWSGDGRVIFFIANMGVHSELFELDPTAGPPRQLTDGSHAIGGWQYAPAVARHVMTVATATQPAEVWTLEAAGGAGLEPGSTSVVPRPAPKQVTHVFDSLARDFQLPKQERAKWKGADGVDVEGLLVYPIDYTPGRRYPLVVQTHGGPRSSDKHGPGLAIGEYFPVLAARGYAILRPNYRGSTGYGDAFLRDMVGGYFRNAHLDVMNGVDHLVTLGIADPDRLAKMGWSAGGHMTNKVITFTNRFKAAASGAGAANWVSMYAQSDTRVQRTPWFGGTPWQANAPIDLYWAHSPLKHAADVKTPTIFLVGERDLRVPMPQSVEMYRALRSNGVPTRLYVAPREGHGWAELRHQLFKMNVELDWFERHVRGRSYEWETAPGDAAPATAPPSGDR